MKGIFNRLGLITCLVLMTSAANAACNRATLPGTDKAISAKGKINQTLLNDVILVEVNYTRCKSGLPALSSDKKLTKAAANHSKWMAKNSTLSHNSNVGGQSSMQSRIAKTGIKVNTGAENLIKMTRYQITNGPFFVKDMATCNFTDEKGNALPPHSYQSLARSAVRQWVDSPTHRKNFMSNRMRVTAAAAAVDPKGSHCGSIYVTQLFVG